MLALLKSKLPEVLQAITPLFGAVCVFQVVLVGAPTALFLRTEPEGGILGEIRFAPSVHAALRPALLVTYVPSFPFGVP